MPFTTSQARYAAALADLYDEGSIALGRQPRPSNLPDHVVHWADGLRLIISRERTTNGRRGIHVSESLVPGTALYTTTS
jgi:hypothetical protein